MLVSKESLSTCCSQGGTAVIKPQTPNFTGPGFVAFLDKNLDQAWISSAAAGRV